MSLTSRLLSASGGVDKLYVDDVFSAYTYTGNGSTQTINNGIDLAGEGGMVWTKRRDSAEDHGLIDTSRGGGRIVRSNTTGAQSGDLGVAGITCSSDGYSLGSYADINGSAKTYASWTFRKAPKFFDVVTWTGDGVVGRTVAHSLSDAPGMILVKRTIGGVMDWYVYHVSQGATKYANLNTTDAFQVNTNGFGNVNPTSTAFTVGYATNITGSTYVAYLFAHDPSADGIIRCGSFTTAGGGNATVNLGWEPQCSLVKASSSTGDWWINDVARAWDNGGIRNLYANTSSAETAYIAATSNKPTATGFTYSNNANTTFIYLAIRRPNKPPTTGTEVYNAIARTGTGAAATVTGVGFAPDLAIGIDRAKAVSLRNTFEDRLRGATQVLTSDNTNAEAAIATSLTAFGMDGVTLGTDNYYNGASPYINHFFKRAPGFFDVVCYTGTGVARTVPHSLGVVPELMIIKRRDAAESWPVYHPVVTAANNILLNFSYATGAGSGASSWNSVTPASSVFTVGSGTETNGSGGTYVAYLFATKAGISKVGSYTGNGTSQTIDCGFTTGARFVMIKRTDSTGDWYIWDTVRGLVAGNDPHLSLNLTTAEITTDDSLDPASVGFIVNQLAATNINVTSASYIYLSFA